MQEFLFYVELGLDHVLSLSAHDHILFLVALAIPFTFKQWRPALLLASVFTLAHCTSLALSVYDILVMDVGLVEFLIPVTILLTSIFNLINVRSKAPHQSLIFHLMATTFFGLVHGFGFSNYFKLLMAEETNTLSPLLGFATGIEISQLGIVATVLCIAYVFQSIFMLKKTLFITISSILILLLTIPMLVAAFPY